MFGAGSLTEAIVSLVYTFSPPPRGRTLAVINGAYLGRGDKTISSSGVDLSTPLVNDEQDIIGLVIALLVVFTLLGCIVSR